MARWVKIALAQACNGWPGYPDPGKSEAVHAFHRQQLDPFVMEAGKQKADILCFCENAMGHGNKPPRNEPCYFEDVLSGPSFQWAVNHARNFGMHVIMPIIGIYRGGISNIAAVIGRRGEVIGVYRKVHLTGSEREGGLTAGDEWPVFDLDFGRIGLMICHDMEFPESARCLSLNGAEIIFWPTHWGNAMGDDWVFSILQGTAALNGVHLASVSLAPAPGKFWTGPGFIARTGLIGTQGEWRFSAGFEPALAIGRIDLDAPTVRKWHGENRDFRESHLSDRRSDTYGRLVEP